MFSTFEDFHSIKRISHDVRHRGLDFCTVARQLSCSNWFTFGLFYRSHMLYEMLVCTDNALCFVILVLFLFDSDLNGTLRFFSMRIQINKLLLILWIFRRPFMFKMTLQMP